MLTMQPIDGATSPEYTLDHVETRTRVPRAQVVEAARIFSGGTRGIATTGTGPDMAPRAAQALAARARQAGLACSGNAAESDAAAPGLENASGPRHK